LDRQVVLGRVHRREARVRQQVGGPSGDRDHRQSKEIQTREPDHPDISRFRLAPTGGHPTFPETKVWIPAESAKNPV
jgi:hypothetical protein